MINRDPLYSSLLAKFGAVKGSGDWLRIPCPTCTVHNRKKFKRYISRTGFSTNCFICGVKKDIRELLDGYYAPIKLEDYSEAKADVVDPRSLELPYTTAIPVNKLELDHPAIKFLHKDHLFDLDRYANDNKIVYVPYEGGQMFINGSVFITSAEHLVFPVYSANALVGWQLRSVPGTFYGDQPNDIRYYHIFNKGSYLYNYDNAIKHKRVVVVEGVKKALKFPNGVATWGSGVSRKQLTLMQNWKEIIVMLDDEEGNGTQRKATEMVDMINAGGKSRAINVKLSKYGVSSPDELSEEVLNIIVEEEWYVQTHGK